MNPGEPNPRRKASVSLPSPLQAEGAFSTPREIKNNADFTLQNGENPFNTQRINNLKNEPPQKHPEIGL
jgi:hypothetical protein